MKKKHPSDQLALRQSAETSAAADATAAAAAGATAVAAAEREPEDGSNFFFLQQLRTMEESSATTTGAKETARRRARETGSSYFPSKKDVPQQQHQQHQQQQKQQQEHRQQKQQQQQKQEQQQEHQQQKEHQQKQQDQQSSSRCRNDDARATVRAPATEERRSRGNRRKQSSSRRTGWARAVLQQLQKVGELVRERVKQVKQRRQQDILLAAVARGRASHRDRCLQSGLLLLRKFSAASFFVGLLLLVCLDFFSRERIVDEHGFSQGVHGNFLDAAGLLADFRASLAAAVKKEEEERQLSQERQTAATATATAEEREGGEDVERGVEGYAAATAAAAAAGEEVSAGRRGSSRPPTLQKKQQKDRFAQKEGGREYGYPAIPSSLFPQLRQSVLYPFIYYPAPLLADRPCETLPATAAEAAAAIEAEEEDADEEAAEEAAGRGEEERGEERSEEEEEVHAAVPLLRPPPLLCALQQQLEQTAAVDIFFQPFFLSEQQRRYPTALAAAAPAAAVISRPAAAGDLRGAQTGAALPLQQQQQQQAQQQQQEKESVEELLGRKSGVVLQGVWAYNMILGVRTRRGDSRDALALFVSAPFAPSSFFGFDSRSSRSRKKKSTSSHEAVSLAALAGVVSGYLNSSGAWLGRDLYFILIEQQLPYSAGAAAWAEAYLRASSYFPRSGLLRMAVVLEAEPRSLPPVSSPEEAAAGRGEDGEAAPAAIGAAQGRGGILVRKPSSRKRSWQLPGGYGAEDGEEEEEGKEDGEEDEEKMESRTDLLAKFRREGKEEKLERYAGLLVDIEGIDGRLPNQDLVNVGMVEAARLGIPIRTRKMWDSIYRAALNLGGHRPHAALLQEAVPATTFLLQRNSFFEKPAASFRYELPRKNLSDFATFIERYVRSQSNVLEALHHSFNFYFYAGEHRHVCSGFYFYPIALMLALVLLPWITSRIVRDVRAFYYAAAALLLAMLSSLPSYLLCTSHGFNHLVFGDAYALLPRCTSYDPADFPIYAQKASVWLQVMTGCYAVVAALLYRVALHVKRQAAAGKEVLSPELPLPQQQEQQSKQGEQEQAEQRATKQQQQQPQIEEKEDWGTKKQQQQQQQRWQLALEKYEGGDAGRLWGTRSVALSPQQRAHKEELEYIEEVLLAAAAAEEKEKNEKKKRQSARQQATPQQDHQPEAESEQQQRQQERQQEEEEKTRGEETAALRGRGSRQTSRSSNSRRRQDGEGLAAPRSAAAASCRSDEETAATPSPSDEEEEKREEGKKEGKGRKEEKEENVDEVWVPPEAPPPLWIILRSFCVRLLAAWLVVVTMLFNWSQGAFLALLLLVPAWLLLPLRYRPAADPLLLLPSPPSPAAAAGPGCPSSSSREKEQQAEEDDRRTGSSSRYDSDEEDKATHRRGGPEENTQAAAAAGKPWSRSSSRNVLLRLLLFYKSSQGREEPGEALLLQQLRRETRRRRAACTCRKLLFFSFFLLLHLFLFDNFHTRAARRIFLAVFDKALEVVQDVCPTPEPSPFAAADYSLLLPVTWVTWLRSSELLLRPPHTLYPPVPASFSSAAAAPAIAPSISRIAAAAAAEQEKAATPAQQQLLQFRGSHLFFLGGNPSAFQLFLYATARDAFCVNSSNLQLFFFGLVPLYFSSLLVFLVLPV